MRKTLRRIQDISQKKPQDAVSFVSAQSIIGTPLFSAVEFEWARFRNEVSTKQFELSKPRLSMTSVSLIN